jgi:hypothetical protein
VSFSVINNVITFGLTGRDTISNMCITASGVINNVITFRLTGPGTIINMCITA